MARAKRRLQPSEPRVHISDLDKSVQGTLEVGVVLDMDNLAQKGIARALKHRGLCSEQLTERFCFFVLNPAESETVFRAPQGFELPDTVMMRAAEYRSVNPKEIEDLHAVVIADEKGRSSLACPRDLDKVLKNDGKSGEFLRREKMLSVQVSVINRVVTAKVYEHTLVRKTKRESHTAPVKYSYEVLCELKGSWAETEAVRDESWNEQNAYMRQAVVQGLRKFWCKDCKSLHYAQKPASGMSQMCCKATEPLPSEERVCEETEAVA